MTSLAICMLQGDFSRMEQIFQTRQFPSDEVEVEEVIAQESQTQPQAQTTRSGTKEKGIGKCDDKFSPQSGKLNLRGRHNNNWGK